MAKVTPKNSNSTVLILCTVASLAIAITSLVLCFTKSDISKIVYIDSPSLLNRYKGMEAARKEYEASVTTLRQNLDSLSREFQAEYGKFQTDQKSMSAREASLTEELLGSKRTQLINYEQAVIEKMKQQEQELTSKVVAHVNEFIKKYAKDKGYRFVLSANQYGSLAYADEGTDITDEILALLNAEHGE